jgi:limonene-1,2-epoxide hydrolase
MPWFPEFFSAVELARRDIRDVGSTDPVGQYFAALKSGDAGLLETAWPGKVTVYDPKAGEIHGHRKLRRFVQQNQIFLAGRHASTRTVASTCVPGRAVVELLVHLDNGEQKFEWPVAVVAESSDDLSVVFRTYCSRWPVDGRRYIRPPILDSAPVQLGDVVARYLAAVEVGDADTAARSFAPDGYFREPIGAHPTHRGTAELRSFFRERFGGSGIGIAPCAVTDDGVRCALEYNLLRWGRHSLTPQAGLVVYERNPAGLLAAARVYDDVEAPVARLSDGPESTPELTGTATMERPELPEDPAERALLETMRATYTLALEPEQHAMISQLRHMRTVPPAERTALINDIENAVGQNLEEDVEF